MSGYRKISACRICGKNNFLSYLDLGITPLANSYVAATAAGQKEFKAPLRVLLCRDCGLSQLEHVVDPTLMFSNYLYVSSTPKTFRDHCDRLAETIREMLKAKSGFALDIASNDGCLLRYFKKRDFKVLGVDPAKNLAEEANASGIPTLCRFWSKPVAEEIVSLHGRPNVITGQNVFAHVDNVHEFVDAVSHCLDPDGIFVLEFPYVIDLIERNLFDTIYHEHASYVGLTPVALLLGQYNFEVVDVHYFPEIHGGTIRIVSARPNKYSKTSNVAKFYEREKQFGIASPTSYIHFGERVRRLKELLVAFLQEAKNEGRLIWGFGASAKGNTLLNYFGITRKMIDNIIDENPKKHGFFTPGTLIPIVGIEEFKQNIKKIDDLLLLVWNFAEEIKKRCNEYGYRGGFIYPAPEPKRVYS